MLENHERNLRLDGRMIRKRLILQSWNILDVKEKDLFLIVLY